MRRTPDPTRDALFDRPCTALTGPFNVIQSYLRRVSSEDAALHRGNTLKRTKDPSSVHITVGNTNKVLTFSVKGLSEGRNSALVHVDSDPMRSGNLRRSGHARVLKDPSLQIHATAAT